MLKPIEGSYASLFPREMDAMFRNRAEIFGERLGWEVVVKDGYERDRFDDLNPLYLVSVERRGHTGARCGSCRRPGRTCCATSCRNCLRRERRWRVRRSGRVRASARSRRPGSPSA